MRVSINQLTYEVGFPPGLKHLLRQTFRERTVVVMGYRGGDNDVRHELKRLAAEHAIKRIIWICHREDDAAFVCTTLKGIPIEYCVGDAARIVAALSSSDTANSTHCSIDGWQQGVDSATNVLSKAERATIAIVLGDYVGKHKEAAACGHEMLKQLCSSWGSAVDRWQLQYRTALASLGADRYPTAYYGCQGFSTLYIQTPPIADELADEIQIALSKIAQEHISLCAKLDQANYVGSLMDPATALDILRDADRRYAELIEDLKRIWPGLLELWSVVFPLLEPALRLASTCNVWEACSLKTELFPVFKQYSNKKGIAPNHVRALASLYHNWGRNEIFAGRFWREFDNGERWEHLRKASILLTTAYQLADSLPGNIQFFQIRSNVGILLFHCDEFLKAIIVLKEGKEFFDSVNRVQDALNVEQWLNWSYQAFAALPSKEQEKMMEWARTKFGEDIDTR